MQRGGDRQKRKGRVFPRRHKREELRRNNSGAGRPVLREFLKRILQARFAELHATIRAEAEQGERPPHRKRGTISGAKASRQGLNPWGAAWASVKPVLFSSNTIPAPS
jgi:hypothetical protein